ncbi:transporter substrate-binding domain-containing protein [Psychrosphaera aquimarina]|uniref:Transporter substrate-binding domain-containing protein n=1 Tax=Psychrosphaera aquimarina TaxID=2044854 RepID=A0ABU3QXH4_9GAMM|nr:transporter substrate-binding domain-containing protein [Psychrosphaera aquimarina]MDU0112117.1 transporter substrate-binding domain-containing protein [Psychrosphaera aquimarina]
MLRNITYIVLSCSLFFTSCIQAKSLNIASDIWCPYICNDKNLPGILIEVLTEIAKVKNIPMNFNIIPLSRSLIMAKRSEIDIVLAITKSHIQEYKLQKSVLYYGGWYNDFYINSQDKWMLNNPQDIDNFLKSGQVLGLIKGYDYGRTINNFIIKYPNSIYQATGNSPLITSIKMLQKGRIAALLDSRFNVEYEMNKFNIVDIRHAGSEGDFVPLFLGYSPKVGIDIIEDVDDGFLFITNNGTFDQILKKYGVSNWHAQGPLK